MFRVVQPMEMCYTGRDDARGARPMPDPNRHQEFQLTGGNTDVVVFVHGILGSPCSFRKMAERLHRQGLDCVALLLPGHGGSARQFSRAKAAQWPEYVKKRLSELRQRFQRIWLVGHSLGGLISLDCAASGLADGLVLLNAPLVFKASPKQIGFSLKIMIGAKEGNDPFLAAYRNDYSVCGAKLYEYPLWVRQFLGLFAYMGKIRRRLVDVKGPVLVLQSARDESVPMRSAKLLMDGLVNAQAELLVLEHSYHLYFPEGDEERVIEAVEGFLTIF